MMEVREKKKISSKLPKFTIWWIIVPITDIGNTKGLERKEEKYWIGLCDIIGTLLHDKQR